MKTKELEGAWEERGVIGTRIEIEGKKITVLWRNSPVLETTFKTEPTEEGLRLITKDCDLRYTAADKPYAAVTKLIFADGKLTFCENFPISGDSCEVLEKTDRSRFGDYTVADKRILPLLKGTWQSDNGRYTFTFAGDKLTFFEQTVKIHALESNTSKEIKLANANPAVYSLFHFTNVYYRGGVITADIPVCDAPSEKITFEKIK